MTDLLPRKPKTQKEIVLETLEAAGPKGAHSFEFLQVQIPRVAARVCELRAEGYEITSEHEVLNGTAEGVRYILNVGVGTGLLESDETTRYRGDGPGASADSGGVKERGGEEARTLPAASLERSVPSCFDPDDCLDWGDAA